MESHLIVTLIFLPIPSRYCLQCHFRLHLPWSIEPHTISNNQLAFLRELDTLFLQQLQLHRLVDPTRCLLPVALEAADVAVTSDDTVAGDLRRKGVVAQRSADGTRRGRQRARQVAVGRYAAFRNNE